MINSGASHTFVAKSMVKSHKWLLASIEQMFIHLSTGSEIVLDSIYIVPIVLCNIGGHAIPQYANCQIIKNLII